MPELSPVILLGGEANALSVARSLAALGVRVHFIGDVDSPVARSRCCTYLEVPNRGSPEQSWAQFLLGAESDHLRGAVVLSCSDAGINVLARHRAALLERYRLDESNPPAQVDMLDKLTTYRHAQAAGVDTPRFWLIDGVGALAGLRDSLVFPLIVKPRLSHVFEAAFGRKHLFAEDFAQLHAALATVAESNIGVMLVEWIPGSDDQLCSYFTYLDEQQTPLLHFTKRVIRRYPMGMGSGSYHITDWIPALIEPSLRLFRQVGLRGVANVEYKLDVRDRRYKLMECNARFTAANCLVAASGVDLAALVYNRMTGRPHPLPTEYRRGLRLWDPIRDAWAMRELRRSGQITIAGWITSVLHRQTFPFFRWTDPMPAVARIAKPLIRRWGGRKPATDPMPSVSEGVREGTAGAGAS
jgi:D-aspartate ligase